MAWDCESDEKYHSVGWMWAHCFGFEEECVEVEFRGADLAGKKIIMDVYRSWKDGYVTLIRSIGDIKYYDGRKRRWSVRVLGISGTGQSAKAAVEICYYEPVVKLAINAFVHRRWGSQMYIAGKITGIQPSDEICVVFRRPEDGKIYNLASDTSGYLYFKGASGSYDFAKGMHYIPFWESYTVPTSMEDPIIPAHYVDEFLPGVYEVEIHDVSETCDELLKLRASASVDLMGPRYQYQVVLGAGELDFPDQAGRLKAAFDHYKEALDWSIKAAGRDCMEVTAKFADGWEPAPSLVWLCEVYMYRPPAICHGLPSWLCTQDDEKIEYVRGECSCSYFGTFAEYGIPCHHIIAVVKAVGGSLVPCPYVPCPLEE